MILPNHILLINTNWCIYDLPDQFCSIGRYKECNFCYPRRYQSIHQQWHRISKWGQHYGFYIQTKWFWLILNPVHFGRLNFEDWFLLFLSFWSKYLAVIGSNGFQNLPILFQWFVCVAMVSTRLKQWISNCTFDQQQWPKISKIILEYFM